MSVRVKSVRVNRSTGGNIAVGFVLVLLGAFFALPLVYAISNSLKPIEEIFIFPPRLLAENPSTENYLTLFTLVTNSLVPFSRYIFNSLFLTVAMIFCNILVSSLAAYPLSKNDFPGKRAIFSAVVTSLLFVSTVTAVPQYIIMSKLKLLNTYFAIILPGMGSTLGVFLIKQFMDTIPYSLIEATKIDGGNDFTILYRVVMPIIRPAWLTLAISTFQSSWNNSGLGFIFDEHLKLLPSVITEIISGNLISRAGVAAAASVILMVPPIVFFVLSQMRVLETMAYAGIKE